MSLSPGARIGPHRVSVPLGAGGLGEVWRAHDTKLGRDAPALWHDRLEPAVGMVEDAQRGIDRARAALRMPRDAA